MKALIYNNPFNWFNPFLDFYSIDPVVFSYTDWVDDKIEESSLGYSIQVHIPKLRKKDLSVKVINNKLIIKGKRTSNNFFKNNSSFTNYYREISFPFDVNQDKIKASFKNQILEIKIPKIEVCKTYKEIKVNGQDIKSENETSKNHNIFKILILKIKNILKNK